MFISSHGDQDHLKTKDQQETTVPERDQQRYEHALQAEPVHKTESIYQHVVKIVNQFISQITGRQQEAQETQVAPKSLSNTIANSFASIANSFTNNNTNNATEAQTQPRQIRGVADRMPRMVDPDNPLPRHDSIFIGDAKDYPAAVIGIEYDGGVHPVFYEGNQVVARHLHLNNEASSIDGQLILNDGRRTPVEIKVITAV